MRKRFAVYPFLFIFYVILNLLINNLDEIDPTLALRPLVVLLLVSSVILVLLRVLFRDWHYASYLLFIILFLFFAYGHLNNTLIEKLPRQQGVIEPQTVLGIMLSIAIILGIPKTWKFLGGSTRLTPFLNLIFVIALITQGVFGLVELGKRHTNPTTKSNQEAILPVTGPEIALDCSISPDIYWIVLDGYGRADVLEELYEVDTSEFLDTLRERGFYVADQSHSNYMQTVYSIPSALYLRYLDMKPKGVSGYDYFPELVKDNRLTALLRQCSYDTVAFETGFFFTNYPSADIYLSFDTDKNEFEGLLLNGTPLDLLLDRMDLGVPALSHRAHRMRVDYTFDKLTELPTWDGPHFIYAHIISPHPPFVFDSRGNSVRPNRSYTVRDGSDYQGSLQEYHAGYAEQVEYVNRRLEKTISEILRRSPTPPIIIIQGDHGPGSYLEWESFEDTCLWERTSILNAYYLPNGGSKYLYPSISPVNSFRIVLNTYFQTGLELLPDETYFTPPDEGEGFIDITSGRESRENCDQ